MALRTSISSKGFSLGFNDKIKHRFEGELRIWYLSNSGILLGSMFVKKFISPDNNFKKLVSEFGLIRIVTVGIFAFSPQYSSFLLRTNFCSLWYSAILYGPVPIAVSFK